MPLGSSQVIKEVAAIAVVAGVPATVWTPAAGKKIRLCGYRLGVSAACSVIFKGGVANYSVGARTPTIGANFGDGGDLADGQGLLLQAADDVLKIDTTVNATVNGYVWGYEE